MGMHLMGMWVCISRGIYLMGMYLMGVYLMGMHLMGMHLTSRTVQEVGTNEL